MKLAFVDICGFRGYQKRVRFDFSNSFTIIDGRNGVGKSTIFDAVEFALTGTISKYLDAKADRESVEDYLWWSGNGDALQDRYVEVGFRDGDTLHSVRRSPLQAEKVDLGTVAARLFDRDYAPKNAIAQLCAATIIRDEHIARLSLDLKEGDRFTLLRDAIGAVDADEWITKAAKLASAASTKVKSVGGEVDQANAAMAVSVRQIDQARSALPAASVLNQAATRLQGALGTTAPADQLAEVARHRIAAIATDLDMLQSLIGRVPEIGRLRTAIPGLEDAVVSAERALSDAKNELATWIAALADTPVSTALSQQARQLENLVNIGRSIGPREGHCPLCASEVSHGQFEHGLEAALVVARQLDTQAVDQAGKERARDTAQQALQHSEDTHTAAVKTRDSAKAVIGDFDGRLANAELLGATFEDIQSRVTALEIERNSITGDLRLLDTISLDQVLVRATEDQSTAKERIARAEARLGRARLAETRAKAIHDATRRAAAETLDQRLERVLPLMSELYKRLRPHPVWTDIEYSVRGDVRRFLKLQVGGGINPQFVFSSGQRRATGLAFLLSVNLSIAWSRWRSILLDDPVQHVDDFRTVHLAEVLAQLCQDGRQIVCAVEDSALADLMCRRLPTSEQAAGKRITLGNDRDGALSISSEQEFAPLSRRTLVASSQAMSA